MSATNFALEKIQKKIDFTHFLFPFSLEEERKRQNQISYNVKSSNGMDGVDTPSPLQTTSIFHLYDAGRRCFSVGESTGRWCSGEYWSAHFSLVTVQLSAAVNIFLRRYLRWFIISLPWLDRGFILSHCVSLIFYWMNVPWLVFVLSFCSFLLLLYLFIYFNFINLQWHAWLFDAC